MILSFSLLWLDPSGNHGLFSIHVLHILVADRSFSSGGEDELSGLQPVNECGDQNFVINFINQNSLFVEAWHVQPQALIFSMLNVQ